MQARFPVFLRCLLTGAVIALVSGGCASHSRLDREFGHSVAQLRQQQLMAPQAAPNRDPVAGIDGQSASAAIAQYQKSFTAPPPQAGAFTIGIGAR